ncbi:DNA polymerase Y family protein [Rathayibacter sp. YIM 133350]|uniref:DNA polymerase Y family protein n=1 Tax=Rathayibacter sp. YIM 133350 TaxID=3131992 RepID=UPI00307D18D2
MSPLGRTIVLWCPDWPVTAAMRAGGIDAHAPVALIDRALVFACSPAARRDGVARGLKLREAQARCTQLITLPYDPLHDARAFEPVLARIEQATPGVQLIRPGTCAVRSRGPARFYGGERQAAAVLLDCLAELGITDARVGIADGPFAAEQAARRSGSDRIGIVEPGGSSTFLAPLPIGLLVEPSLSTLLLRLGVRSLGDFAALPAVDVHRRFGAIGAHAHAIAAGRDGRMVIARTPPKDFEVTVAFEPPLDRVDQVSFGVRTAAEDFIAAMTKARLVCTGVRVSVLSESGEVVERSWMHPRWFTPTDVLDRVRWQLQGSGAVDSGLRSAVAAVTIAPERTDSTANHEEGLWGSGPDERVHHGLTRVQSMLGHEGVVTAVIGGGRLLADRQILVPWGDEPPADAVASAERPWPGSLPDLAPATVFRAARPVTVLTDAGAPVIVDDRGMLTGEPRFFSPTGRAAEMRAVAAWAGPWPVVERWWDSAKARRVCRLQLVDDDGIAWLLLLEGEAWQAEARYD